MFLRFDVLGGRLLEFRFARIAAEIERFAFVLCFRRSIFFVDIHPAHWIFCHLYFPPFARLFYSQNPTMPKDSMVVILSFAHAFTKARWLPNMIGPIVLDKSVNKFFWVLVVENAGSRLFAADPDNLFHDLRYPSGSGKDT